MTREQLQEKSLNDLREIAKLQGVKSLTKYRKGELVDIIMSGGNVEAVRKPSEPEAGAEQASVPAAAPAPQAERSPARIARSLSSTPRCCWAA